MNDLDQSQVDAAAFNLRSGSLGLSLRFDPEAIAGLKREIGAGFLSIPRRGAEVGGILTGELVQNDSEWIIAIEAVIPVPIEYQYGPSYRLSAVDKEDFRAHAERSEPGARRIGWYRSNTRPVREPEETDLQISQTFFGSNQSIFLFCEPSADGRIRASCIITLPGGAIVTFPFELGRFSRLDALLKRPEEPPAKPFIHRAVQVEELAPSPASSARPEPVPVAAPPFRRPRYDWGGKLKLAAVVLGASIMAYYARGRIADSRPAAPAGAAASLGLRVEYQGDSLLLGWDRASPQVVSAISGVVSIADGGRTRVLNLSPRELQNGSILYQPAAGEISVELDVAAPGGHTASQSIRIIGASAPVSTAAASPKAAPQAASHRGSIYGQVEISGAHFEAPPPPARTPPERSIATLEPPAINSDGLTRVPGSESALGVLPPEPAAAPRPGVMDPSPSSRPFHAATPIRSPQPLLPQGESLSQQGVDRPFEVKVEVAIDENGRVTNARLVNEAEPHASLLGPSALNTVRSWTFQPATLDGQAVASTMVLTFRYSDQR